MVAVGTMSFSGSSNRTGRISGMPLRLFSNAAV